MLTLEESFMIKVLYRKGVSISEIARRTGRDRKTIRHIATIPLTASSPAARQGRARNIHPYIPYLTQRNEEGVLRGILGREPGARVGTSLS